MKDFNTVVITKRGSKEDGVSFSVHNFPASTEEEVQAIISHPTFAGWKYGISIGYATIQQRVALDKYPDLWSAPRCRACRYKTVIIISQFIGVSHC